MRLGELLALPSVTCVAMDCEIVGNGRQGITLCDIVGNGRQGMNSLLAQCSLATIDEINHDGNNGKQIHLQLPGVHSDGDGDI